MGNVENWFTAAKLILNDTNAVDHLQEISDISHVPLSLLEDVFATIGEPLESIFDNAKITAYLSEQP